MAYVRPAKVLLRSKAASAPSRMTFTIDLQSDIITTNNTTTTIAS